MAEHILIIEDDTGIASLVAEYLARFGLRVSHAANGSEGLRMLRVGGYDALILDVMLPDTDGFDLCRQVRTHSDLPILMLTARGDETDRVVGLELGADDYLPKPFSPRELLARLRAILRRRGHAGTGARKLLRFGRLEVDHDAREVRVEGQARPLTGYQFDLLWVLATNAGKVMSRDALMDKLKGGELEAFDRSLDVHVSRIRAAIEDDPKHPRRIITVRGAGYVFARQQDSNGHD